MLNQPTGCNNTLWHLQCMYRWRAEAATRRPSNVRTDALRDGPSKPSTSIDTSGMAVAIWRRGGVMTLAGSVGVGSEVK
jgi:hypothetical protein